MKFCPLSSVLRLTVLFLLSTGLPAQILPTPAYVPVTAASDGTLRTPATFWSANASSIASALSLSSTYQPLDSDLTAIAALTTTSAGRSLLTASALTATGLGLANGNNIDGWGAKTLPSGPVVGTSDTQTLTNKSIDAGQLTGSVVAARMPALTGDVTTSSGAVATTLATVNSSPNTYGSATQSLTATVNAKGLITSMSAQTVTPAIGSITGLGTGVGTALTVNTGSAGAVILYNGALGTPTSGTLTNATGLPLTSGVTGTLPVANGGTGATTITANNVILGNGTSAVQVVAPGTSGNVLTSNGTTWISSNPPSGTTITSEATARLGVDNSTVLSPLAASALLRSARNVDAGAGGVATVTGSGAAALSTDTTAINVQTGATAGSTARWARKVWSLTNTASVGAGSLWGFDWTRPIHVAFRGQAVAASLTTNGVLRIGLKKDAAGRPAERGVVLELVGTSGLITIVVHDGTTLASYATGVSTATANNCFSVDMYVSGGTVYVFSRGVFVYALSGAPTTNANSSENTIFIEVENNADAATHRYQIARDTMMIGG